MIYLHIRTPPYLAKPPDATEHRYHLFHLTPKYTINTQRTARLGYHNIIIISLSHKSFHETHFNVAHTQYDAVTIFGHLYYKQNSSVNVIIQPLTIVSKTYTFLPFGHTGCVSFSSGMVHGTPIILMPDSSNMLLISS